MVKDNDIDYLKYLYENIFGENAWNSKEFINFVQKGNPHPLRIKIEDYAYNRDSSILEDRNSKSEDRIKFLTTTMLVKELDTYITNYIEDNV
jgi:hypothetical protein